MSILTSDYISTWQIVGGFENSFLRYLIKSINHTYSISAKPQDAIQGEAGTVIIDLGEEINTLQITGDAIIQYDYLTLDPLTLTTPLPTSVVYQDIFDLFWIDYKKLLNFFLVPTEMIRNSLRYFHNYVKLINSTNASDNLTQTQIVRLLNAQFYTATDFRTYSTITDFTTSFRGLVNSYLSQNLPTAIRNSVLDRSVDVFDILQIFRESIINNIDPAGTITTINNIIYNLYLSTLDETTTENFNTDENFLLILNGIQNISQSDNFNFWQENLLQRATINIGDDINCTLNYLCSLEDKLYKESVPFNNFGDLTDITKTDSSADFIARTAKNYDCRFYLDGQEYKIKSGTININIEYSTFFMANVGDRIPFYSPQSHSLSGSLSIVTNNDIQIMNLEANCSLVIGTRHFEFGHASVKSQYQNQISGDNLRIIDIEFTAYTRAGAGIYSPNQRIANNRDIWQTFLRANKGIF